jgi:3-hydroxyacyl-CoA dehydrogenase
LLQQQKPQFYKIETGNRLEWKPSSSEFIKTTGKDAFIILDYLRKTNKVWGNDGATLFDLGDGILNLEFHSKMNTMGSEVVQGIQHAVSEAEKNFRGLVIGNQGANFSAGANLALLFMFAIEQEYDEIDLMIRQFQQTIMRVRYSSIPVVVAPHGLTLGGGCELTLHADRVQAAAETYIGLVEVGVGLIPGGGGTKEMTLRLSDSFEKGDAELNNLQEVFLTMATGKVATSAKEAFDMKIFRRGDQVSMSKNRQIRDAKQLVLELADAGYVQPVERNNIKVMGKAGLGFIKAGTYGMLAGGYISEHDLKVAEKLAWVMCGGDLTAPQLVTEQYLLDMEREAFLSLLGERKTLERIQSIVAKGKPLRN